MSSFLERAAVSARNNIASWKERLPDPDSMDRSEPPLFLGDDTVRCGVIAEVKKRSPSRGDLIGDNDPLDLPALYADAGAEAVSVVVEERYFGGTPELFRQVSEKTDLPLLWKDFVVDPYQIYVAAGLGASAVLLIAGMLSDSEMIALIGIARGKGLSCLVEVHNRVELDRALDSGADLVGVNNRDLVTLEVDISVSEKLASRIPDSVASVSESGIRTPEDVARMAACGYRAVLIGESLVTAEDTKGLLMEMVEAGKAVKGDS